MINNTREQEDLHESVPPPIIQLNIRRIVHPTCFCSLWGSPKRQPFPILIPTYKLPGNCCSRQTHRCWRHKYLHNHKPACVVCYWMLASLPACLLRCWSTIVIVSQVQQPRSVHSNCGAVIALSCGGRYTQPECWATGKWYVGGGYLLTATQTCDSSAKIFVRCRCFLEGSEGGVEKRVNLFVIGFFTPLQWCAI